MQRRVNRRVLVIEDDNDIRRLITESLRGAGLDVVAAIDASQALRTALARKPAAVVLDIGLPDYDGTQFIARWRERRPDAAEVPIAIVSSSTPVKLTIEADQGATEIRGWIYDLEAPSASGGPNEEFTLPGRSGTYAPRSIIAARTYQVVLNVRWSFVVTEGEVTHLFRLRTGP